MTWLQPAVAWAGAIVAVAAAAFIFWRLQRFMAGPPEPTQGVPNSQTQAAIQQALAAERASQRHWGANGKP